MAPILARAQGADLSTLAARQLFDPMGIDRFEWRRDRDGNPLAPARLVMRTRDLLKLAGPMIANGNWRTTQPLPASWVKETALPWELCEPLSCAQNLAISAGSRQLAARSQPM
jgi:CubicO group peptidase (beta-lactamase class C family)